MASESIVINNFARPSLILDELAVPNRSSPPNENVSILMDTDEKSFGAYQPVVFINGSYVEKFIESFELDMNGFLPVLRFKFTMRDPLFISVNFPKDGDVVSVYLRSWVSAYKPLRMDFNVLKVQSSPSDTSEGEGMSFQILAETRIPRLYNEVSKAFRNKTSYETLFDVSQELDLGFSSNESEVTDEMTWICPNMSYYDFIQEVVSRSYKDDRSFFISFIDCYYNLNFINLNNQLTPDDPFQTAMVIRGMGSRQTDDTSFQGTELIEYELPLFLNNQKGNNDLPFFITGYTLLSDAGNIANRTGYIQEVQFWDEGLKVEKQVEKYVKYTIESITTENVGENVILQKGRAKEKNYQAEYRKNWYGVLNNFADGGVHENFIQALAQNTLNLEDVSKFVLQVRTVSYYSGFYRGMVLPVAIYVNKQGLRKENVGVSEDQNPEQTINPVLDTFLSGVYVLTGFQVKYDPINGLYMHLNLTKREWTLNSAGRFPKFFPVNFISG